MLGGTILYDSRADVERALPEIERLAREAGWEVIESRKKNRFDNPSAGYKDYLLNIRHPNGFVSELLLTTKAMSEAKNGESGIGHDLYEAIQIVQDVLNDKNATKEQIQEAKYLGNLLKEASESYYGSTGDQSNETATLSGIVEPLKRTSAYIPGDSSNLYLQLEPLLERIRNKVPSSEYANGMSSYSRNSVTNTVGEPSSGSYTATGGLDDTGGLGTVAPPSDANTIPQQKNNVNEFSGNIGGDATILTSGVEDPAHYEVRELSEVVPSHDPANGFRRREDYPPEAQERPYHSDRGEQDKVRRNALSFDSRYLLNTNPDAGNGPPIVTRNGIVLGGNSRAMSLGLVYAENAEKAGAYKDNLTRQVAMFGIDPAVVQGMNQPVLVRVLESDLSTSEMAIKSRLYNQTLTQGIQAKAEGISKARLITPNTLAIFSRGMEEHDTLRAYLDTAASKELISALEADGVLEVTQLQRLIDEDTGRLNDAGKTLVENSLRGFIVQDYDTLAATPDSVLKKLDRAIPALARMKEHGEGWNMSGIVTAALRQIGKADTRGHRVEMYLGQVDMFEIDPDKNRPTVQAIALTLANATQKEVQARFNWMAERSAKRTKGQNTMLAGMSTENTPAKAFVTAFLEPMAVVDGEAIANFSPAENQTHAALEYAYRNGGKGHNISIAVESLEKELKRYSPHGRG